MSSPQILLWGHVHYAMPFFDTKISVLDNKCYILCHVWCKNLYVYRTKKRLQVLILLLEAFKIQYIWPRLFLAQEAMPM